MGPGILSVDVGGLSVKAAVTDSQGVLLSERVRSATPHPCPPDRLLDLVVELVRDLPDFNRISVGFPGVVRRGCVLTAANLQSELWFGFDLAQAVSARLGGYPARVINDADMIGLAVCSGKGVEVVITLGTGFGTAVLRDGELMPHMELAHHPVAEGHSYDQYLGDAALKAIGKAHWNDRLAHALGLVNILFHPDGIILTGGNARNIVVALPPNARIASDLAGIAGGAALWRETSALSELFSG
ncbi:ROK family protein [Halopseudomonas sp.]|uniref:ROK family protein n=1 Tax=Halopseudomonas sp. TaxID=2901191 RepID=UPI001A4FDC60|nr:ROK family protein [Pseudomonas sp.]|tara:strand:+ start:84918 stop:85646 length:729 start_codon:yes stop_codon:yes gene_type:complete